MKVSLMVSKKTRKPAVNDNVQKVFNIGADQHFIKSLAKGVLKEAGDDPLKLSDYTILVPSMTVAKSLREAFAELSETSVTIMPNIMTPEDVDQETVSLRISGDRKFAKKMMDVPPAISRLERQVILAREILKMPNLASSPQKAVQLGAELGVFLDELQRECVDLNKATKLVPKKHQQHWQKTKDFLEILTDVWPKILSDMGMVDPIERQNQIIDIQTKYWQKNVHKKPVIAAGFSHATPGVRRLLKSVCDMPEGRLVFPGLDVKIDKDSWQVLTEMHPQFGMKQVMDEIDVSLEQVGTWAEEIRTGGALPRIKNAKVTNEARQKLLSEVMRPIETAEKWSLLKTPTKAAMASTRRRKRPQDDHEIDPRALTGMDLITIGTPQEEASVIALKMREILERKGNTIALVTADRSLARRVSARLRYWDIDVPDMEGCSLSETNVGSWLQMTAQMASDELAPIPFLECLKHPLTTFGQSKETFNEMVYKLEDYVMHGPRPAAGFLGLKRALRAEFNALIHRKSFMKDQLVAEQKELELWLKKIEKSYRPFAKMMVGKARPFSEILDAHIHVCETMAGDDKEKGERRIWQGEDGVAASRFLSELRNVSDSFAEMTGREYQGVLETLLKNRAVKTLRTTHANVMIMSPKQARLIKPDMMIVAGLNEGSWPMQSPENLWLSREMLTKMRLSSPDAVIGQSAHDFTQAISNPNVMMMRAQRTGDAPTVPSSFLTRLMMVLKGIDLADGLQSKSQLAGINAALQTPAKIESIAPPAPTPDTKYRPKQLPVTAVELFLRDPYALYAKYILKLKPKDPIDSDPTYAERGTFIHDALEKFVLQYPDDIPKDAYQKLLDIGQESFRIRKANPAVQAFWWPRFERIAKWFVKQEEARRERARTLGVEVQGKLAIDTGNFKFILTAIADRIDILDDDRLSIVDYKTGGVPTQKSVEKGFSPQLTLEALIAQSGGFEGIDANDVDALEYWRLSGGRPAGKVTLVNSDISRLEDEARAGLYELVKAFSDKKTPYLSTPRPPLAPRFNYYRHLARSDEWGRNNSPGKSRGGRMRPKSATGRTRKNNTNKRQR